MTTFYLGTHEPSWLKRLHVPLFVSRRRFERYKSVPRAVTDWALDSGGFTELSMHGGWHQVPAERYAAQVRYYHDEIGRMQWAAPQDWMCEPIMLKRTGKSVRGHQELTTANYLRLVELDPGLPWAPVLQGFTVGDYLRHMDDYRAAGVDLHTLPVVGVGSVCRRQDTDEIAELFAELWLAGLRNLHGFGVKSEGLALYGPLLASADSLAWSQGARYDAKVRGQVTPGCTHKGCQNCDRYALRWRSRVLATIPA